MKASSIQHAAWCGELASGQLGQGDAEGVDGALRGGDGDRNDLSRWEPYQHLGKLGLGVYWSLVHCRDQVAGLYSQHDHLPREPEAGERRWWREDRTKLPGPEPWENGEPAA